MLRKLHVCQLILFKQGMKDRLDFGACLKLLLGGKVVDRSPGVVDEPRGSVVGDPRLSKECHLVQKCHIV